MPELLDAELFVPELFEAEELFEAAPPFFAAAVFPAAPPLVFADDLEAAPFFGEAFAEPVFADVLLLAELEEPDFALPDFAAEDLEDPDFAELDFAAPDFADVDLDPAVFDEPDPAVEDLAVELFADPELFAPPFAAPADEREREVEPPDAPDFPVTVSAAAPIAPTAAPCAAPLRISPATSITASITFAVVDDCRLVLLPEPFELADAVRFELFCFVVFLSGMIFSLIRIEQMFVLKLSH